MEDAVQQLIEAKMKLAESQESLLIKSQLYRELVETHAARQEQVAKMQAEIASLYDSISQLSEERNALVLLLEDSPRAGSFVSLDATDEDWNILERNSEQSTRDLWAAVLESSNKLLNGKKIKGLARKGIHHSVRGAIWGKMIENRLCITEELYNLMVGKRRTVEMRLELPGDIRKNLNSEQSEKLCLMIECFLV
jgi:HD-GYP domain-containing protein (c-di-GMP phosphodiesterase class II)